MATEKQRFYVTVPIVYGGPGFVLVHADSEADARMALFAHYGIRWGLIVPSEELTEEYKFCLAEIEG